MKDKRVNIKAVVFIQLCCILKTPLSIGSGENEETDHDCVLGYDGKPFVPATSICGLLRRSMSDADAKRLMGYAHDRGSEVSRLRIGDGIFELDENSQVIDIWDSVALDEHRVAKDQAKFNYQIIRSGFSFKVDMDFMVYEGENIDDFLDPLRHAIGEINEGRYCLGYKSNRGLGMLSISATQWVFKGNDRYKSIAFRSGDADAGRNLSSNLEQNTYKADKDRTFYSVTVPADILGTIMVRHYLGLSEGPDCEVLTDGKQAIIPGSSLAGACRHTADLLLRELGMENASIDKTLAWMFGHVQVENKRQPPPYQKKVTHVKRPPTAWASAVSFSEAKIEDGHAYTLTRTKVDRFTGSAAYRALFTHRIHYGGNTLLRFNICGTGLEWAVGLLLLVLRDMDEGLTPLGGEIAVGRGLLKLDWNQLKINGKDITNKGEDSNYMMALAKFVADQQRVFPEHVRVAFDRPPQEVDP